MNRLGQIDIIVFGATGFTGRLVAEHLAKSYGSAGGPSWGLAGRSLDKLAKVRDAVGAAANTPLFEADARDADALARLAVSAKAIISTAGPYQLYGSGLVAACAAAGTDYLDINGEPLWMRAMIDAHEATARQSGARIVFSCGFDSLPSELGVRLCQEMALAEWGAPLRHIQARHIAMSGGAGGGSIATGKATMEALRERPSDLAALQDAFLLTPGFRGPAQPSSMEPSSDPEFGPVLPFFLSSINIQNVHRANFLMSHAYGVDFAYDEMMIAEPRGGNPFAPPAPGEDFKLQPGEGPSEAQRAAGFFEMVFRGAGADGRKVRASVSADVDPGHTATAKMIAETAVCLIEAPDVAGGFLTPGAALGLRLVDRLRERAGIAFSTSAD